MANQEILNFIREQLAAGYTEAQIREALAHKKWPEVDVDAAFNEWRSNPTLPDTKIVGRFIGESWEIFKNLFQTIMQILGKVVVKFLMVAIPGIVLAGVGYYLVENDQMSRDSALAAGVGLLVVYVIVMAYFAIWFQVSNLLLVKNRHTPLTADQAIEQAKPLIRPFFATSVLVGIMTLLWGILFIIPGIIYGLYYSFAEYIVIDKNIQGWAALQMSKKYVQGIWWQVFSSVLGLIAVSVLIYIVAAVGGVFLGPIGENIISFLINIFYVPYSLIYMYLVYEKLKALKPEVV